MKRHNACTDRGGHRMFRTLSVVPSYVQNWSTSALTSRSARYKHYRNLHRQYVQANTAQTKSTQPGGRRQPNERRLIPYFCDVTTP
ncbi:hypothetical protein ACOMHN_001370 [Nucella lapillus]